MAGQTWFALLFLLAEKEDHVIREGISYECPDLDENLSDTEILNCIQSCIVQMTHNVSQHQHEKIRRTLFGERTERVVEHFERRFR